MPKQVELRVVVDKGYGQDRLRVGDVIQPYTGCPIEVSKIETKQKWAFVYDGDVRVRLPLGSEVNVTRDVATEEENMVEAAERIMESAQSSVRMTALYVEGRTESLHEHFSLDKAATLAYYIELNKLWATVQLNADFLIKEKEEDEVWAWVRAVGNVLEVCRTGLVSKYRHRALSRSTSVISNIEEDLAKEAAAEFIEEWRYHHVDDVLGYWRENILTDEEEVL